MEKGAQVCLFNESGKLLKVENIPNNSQQYRMEVVDFPSGVYLLELSDGKRGAKKKFVIN